jgi:serine protease Do
VLAVGNPFNLGGTVTAGIVSARGRDINAGPYVDFIQSDAAINRGNSGGPMFNLDGEVIGVNTAIFSPNGGSIGIGFAIPSSMAKTVVADLKEHGSVERGWLGVSIQQVTPELAEGLGLDEPKGALVAKVLPDSPAAEVDIQAGDVIVGFNGQPVKEMRELPRLVAGVRAGSSADIKLWRNGEERQVKVEISKQTEDRIAAARGTPNQPDSGASSALGAKLAALDDSMRQELGLEDATQGVVITDLSVSGRAAEQGLRVGDVIEQVGGEAVLTPKDVDRQIEAAHSAEKNAVVMLVNRRGNTLFVGMPLKKG